MTYDIYFDTTTPPSQVAWNVSQTTFGPGALEFGTTYYWQIIAWDTYGANTEGPLWHFTTRINNPPVPPFDPSPINESIDISIDTELDWDCYDPDYDPVTYDVYFGASSNPPQIAWNHTQTMYDPGILEFGTTYYWQIIAWDTYGANTEGPLWHFTTEEEPIPVPDLECTGALHWTDVEPGSTVSVDIEVENIGEPQSLLNWEIASYPSWGTWTFTPNHGEGLQPEDGPLFIEVDVVAPDQPESEFEGEVKIVNSDDPADFCILDVTLATPMSQPYAIKSFFSQYLFLAGSL